MTTDFFRISNFDYTTLTSSISQTGTTIGVVDATVFPSAPFSVKIDDEILRVTGVISNTLYVSRAQENTRQAIHSSGTQISSTLTEAVIHGLFDKFRNSDSISYDQYNESMRIEDWSLSTKTKVGNSLSLYQGKWETVRDTGIIGVDLSYPTADEVVIRDMYIGLYGESNTQASGVSYARTNSGTMTVSGQYQDGIIVYEPESGKKLKYVGSYQNRNSLATTKILKVYGARSLEAVDLRLIEYIGVTQDGVDSPKDEIEISGISRTYDGHEVMLFNDNDKYMRLYYNSAVGSGNNIITPFPEDCLTVEPQGGIKLIYDAAKSGWRTVANIEYGANTDLTTINVKTYQQEYEGYFDLYTKIASGCYLAPYGSLPEYNVWRWSVSDEPIQTKLCNMYCGFPSGCVNSFSDKTGYYVKYASLKNYSGYYDIPDDRWIDVYDANSPCKKYIENETGTHPYETLFYKMSTIKSYPSQPLFNNPVSWTFWWVQNDKTVKVKKYVNTSTCSSYCATAGGGATTPAPGVTTTAGPTTTATPTTTTAAPTTTRAPGYYYCIGGGTECPNTSRACSGPFYSAPITFCSVSGPYATYAACISAGCTTTAAPTTTTAAPTTTATPTTTTTTAAPTTTLAPTTGSGGVG